MGHTASRVLEPARLVVLGALAAVASCSRTGLELSARTTRLREVDANGVSVPAPDSGPAIPSSTPDGAAPPTTPPNVGIPGSRACESMPEACNGRDDDCNGHVDDGILPIACSGGGSRYCVGGRFTACPKRCDACVPGSERVCFHAYCTYWAVQACTADGKSFGICRERVVPSECAGVAGRFHESPELEQCCIDNGYCCQDEFDLDHDGDRSEMLGTCDEVSCHS